MKIAFVFSPQGSQEVSMGKRLYETNAQVKHTMDQANALLDYDLFDVMFNNQDALNQTRYAQMALFVLSCAIKDAINAEGIVSSASAGLSLGEFAALYDQDVIHFKQGIDIVNNRGRLMEKATRDTNGTMAAVRSDLDTLQNALRNENDVFIANYNIANQFVISGETHAIEQFKTTAKEKGIKRVREIDVAGAFHTKFMKSAAEAFETYLQNVSFNPPRNAFYSNTTMGTVESGFDQLLVKQMVHPVKFYPMIEQMIADGYDTFVELGHGTTLKTFIKKINPNVKSLHVSDDVSLAETLKELKNDG